jgi:hypothetical protein
VMWYTPSTFRKNVLALSAEKEMKPSVKKVDLMGPVSQSSPCSYWFAQSSYHIPPLLPYSASFWNIWGLNFTAVKWLSYHCSCRKSRKRYSLNCCKKLRPAERT